MEQDNPYHLLGPALRDRLTGFTRGASLSERLSLVDDSDDRPTIIERDQASVTADSDRF